MRRPEYRNYLLLLLALTLALKETDLLIFSLLMEPIKSDLGLSDTQMGLLSGLAFTLTYSTLGVPIAMFADRGHRVLIIKWTLALWGTLTMACGLSVTYTQMLLARLGVGVGEAGTTPPSHSLISEYFPREERAKAMSLFFLGQPVTIVIGFGAAGWLNEYFGWRTVFLVIGIPALLLAALVHFTLREPNKANAKADGPPENARSYIRTLSQLWAIKSYRYMVIAFTIIHLVSNGIAQWVPAFLIRTHHIGTGELGTWYSIVWGVGGALGTYVGGVLISRYAGGRERLQLLAMTSCLMLFIPLYMGLYIVSDVRWVWPLMLGGALFYSMLYPTLFSMMQDVVPADRRAAAPAMAYLFGNLIGMGLGPLIVGATSDFLRGPYGDESLRIALIAVTPGYLLAGFFLMHMRQFVEQDIASHAPTQPSGISTAAQQE